MRFGAAIGAKDDLGMDALMYAAGYNENPEMTLAVLHAGGSVKATDKNGATALILAARHTLRPEVIGSLLDAGADPAAKDKQGRRALDYAAQNPQVKGSQEHRRLYQATAGADRQPAKKMKK